MSDLTERINEALDGKLTTGMLPLLREAAEQLAAKDAALRIATEELRECRTFIRAETRHMPTVLHLDGVIGNLENLLPDSDQDAAS